MGTDLELSTLEMIAVYGYRFKIEVAFKQALHTLGTYAYQREFDVSDWSTPSQVSVLWSDIVLGEQGGGGVGLGKGGTVRLMTFAACSRRSGRGNKSRQG